MSTFDIEIVTTLEVVASIEVKAKNEDAAQKKILAMIDAGKFALKWEQSSGFDFEESDQTTEIESCNKQEQ